MSVRAASAHSVTSGPLEVVVRSNDLYATAGYLSVFGVQPVWLPPLSEAASDALYGEAGPLQQLRCHTPGYSSFIRIVESNRPVAKLREFELGGHGIDFYSNDVELSRDLAVAAGSAPVQPVEWFEEKERLVEARMLEPAETFAVFTPQMDAVSRLHPSAIDSNRELLHSELCMTSWVVDPHVLDEERHFWGDVMGLRVLLDTAMDANDMQALMGLSRPEPLSSVQFARDGYALLVDLLFYEEGVASSRSMHETSAVSALVFETAGSTDSAAVAADRGDGPRQVSLVLSPAGIAVELWARA